MLAALEAYRRAVELNPRDYRAWYGLGQTYELLHMPFYALNYFRQATQVGSRCAATPLSILGTSKQDQHVFDNHD